MIYSSIKLDAGGANDACGQDSRRANELHPQINVAQEENKIIFVSLAFDAPVSKAPFIYIH